MINQPQGVSAQPQGQMPQDPMMSMEDDGQPLDDGHPAFVAATNMMEEVLYANGAAEQIAEALRTAPTPMDGLFDTAYQMVEILDEKTNGEIPDELLGLLAMVVLNEVAEIGINAGVQYSGADVAEAFKRMALRFVAEQGYDTTELEQAMGQVDPHEFDQYMQSGQPQGGPQQPMMG